MPSANSVRQRKRPNVLLTGTPGTGKTTTAQMLADATGMQHVEVGRLVKEKGLHTGFDQVFQSFHLDEDAVVDELEPIMEQGGVIVDHHGCDFFPERWFDIIVVLRTSNDLLFPRLEKRGYSDVKITENIECEIMQVVEDEARESYASEIVFPRKSETVQDMQDTVDWLTEWVESVSQA